MGFLSGAPGGVSVGTRIVFVKVVGTFLLPLGFLEGIDVILWVLSMLLIIWDKLSCLCWGLAGTRVALWLSDPTMSATARELVITSGR